VTGSIELTLPGGKRFQYRSALMDFLGRGLFFGGLGWWEPEILRVLPGLARTARGVVDVGAHTGLFTLIALTENPAARAVAIEPVMANAQLLHANLRENGFLGRCVVAVAAVAEAPGVVQFDLGPVEVPMTASIAASGRNGALIPAVCVDAVAEWLSTVDLIKIDVEGFEHLVLSGCRETLGRYRPTLVIECLPGSRVEEFADTWEELGYRRFHLLPDRAKPIASICPTIGAPTHNYLLTTRPEMLAEISGSPVSERFAE
jgi:FkbM family methyltransferase